MNNLKKLFEPVVILDIFFVHNVIVDPKNGGSLWQDTFQEFLSLFKVILLSLFLFPECNSLIFVKRYCWFVRILLYINYRVFIDSVTVIIQNP